MSCRRCTNEPTNLHPSVRFSVSALALFLLWSSTLARRYSIDIVPGRVYVSSAAVGSVIIVAGGLSTSNGTTPLSSLFAFDTATTTVLNISQSLAEPRYFMSVTVTGNTVPFCGRSTWVLKVT